MILSKEISLPVVEPKDDASFTETGSFCAYGDEIISASTPKRGRSISYLELRSPCNEASLLSDTSLQRMRCLSQSINDLKILREKQQERQHEMGDLLNDDFLKEHARKLKDARDKIKMLEAKYQGPQRIRNKLSVSSLDTKGRNSALDGRNKSLVLTGSTGELSTLEGHKAKFTLRPFTLRLICSTARMKLPPVPIFLSVLALPIYMVQARIKWVRVLISSLPCYKLSVV